MSVVFNDNKNNYLQLALTSGRPVTIMAWAKPKTVGGNYCGVVEVGRDDPDYALKLSLVASDLADIYDHLGSATGFTSYPEEYSLDEWNHFILTAADNVDRALWLNGVEITHSYTAGSGTESMTFIVVGRSLFNPSSPQPFDGKIAHVAIWDVVLSDAEIESLAAKTTPIQDVQLAHLLGYWKLVDGPDALVGDDLTEQGTITYDAGDDPLLEWSGHFTAFAEFTPVMTCLTLAPAWQRWTWPVTEVLHFPANVLQSGDRTEQRIALRRKVPNQSYQTKLLAVGEDEVAAMESAVNRWLRRTWPVPIWPESAQLGAVLPAGSSSIPVDTRYADYRDDGYAVLWNLADHEIVRIATVADDSLGLSIVTAKAWTASDWIMPLRQGRITAASAEERLGGGALLEVRIGIVDPVRVTGYAAALEYDSLPVLTDPAVWSGRTGKIDHDPDVAVLDSGAGPFEVVRVGDNNETGQGHSWVCRTPAQCWSLRQFMHYVCGPQKAFLVPTFRRDLSLTRAATSDAVELYVKSARFALNLDGDAIRTYVAYRSGESLIVRKVTDIATVSASEEFVTIDAALGVSLAAGGYLSWVDRCRLASGEVQFDWQGRGRMTCEVDLVRVF
ncbi:MAG: LamG domain-containing protein [Phycisphaerales bacterium]